LNKMRALKTKAGSTSAISIINSLMIFLAGAFVSHVLHNSQVTPDCSCTDPKDFEAGIAKIVEAVQNATTAAAAVTTPTSSDSSHASTTTTTSSSAESERSTLSSYDSTVAEEYFVQMAKTIEPVTDKVTDHRYHRMYGQFLLPFYKKKPNMKFFEIGLGCDMSYGPGASSQLWKKLFPEAEIWEGEFDAACVEKVLNDESGALDGLNVVTGDQGNVTVLDKWIQKSGGDFDVVIDDGGHNNCEILTTFHKFWPLLKPGGLYFLEDLHVGNLPWYNKIESPLCKLGTKTAEELLKKTVDNLLFARRDPEVKFLTCQWQSCVLQKNG